MRLIGTRVANWDLLTIVYLKSPDKKRTLFVYTRIGFESLSKQIPKHLNKKTILLPNDPKIIAVHVLAHSGLVIRCCPMADSKLVLELLFLHIRGGCSLAVLLFFLILVRTCCFILSGSLCVVRPTYQASHRHRNS